MLEQGYLVLETGEIFPGKWRGGSSRAGEVVFNTSHAGYEEIATDPSYFGQIMIMTAPMQGNYGAQRSTWESSRMWFDGFVSLEIQESERDASWLKQLTAADIPVLTDLDTRQVVLRIRDLGTPWGALVTARDPESAKTLAQELILRRKSGEKDWVHQVTRREVEIRKGAVDHGPRVAVLDYGCKENTLRELLSRCSEVAVFPSRTLERVIRDYAPSGIMLSNGPGDPADVKTATETVRDLIGWRPIFGICMGNQILARALGASTYKLKFGHRGGNHPVRDLLLEEIYVTSQNHGYCVDSKTLPSDARVTHVNLNDQTLEGFECPKRKCFSVQYHPESRPGPNDARRLFDYFINSL